MSITHEALDQAKPLAHVNLLQEPASLPRAMPQLH